VIARAVAAVPDEWLDGSAGSAGEDHSGAAKLRDAYGIWLRARRAALPNIIEEAERARAKRV